MNKEFILFDLDGTITDSFLGIANSIQYALKKLNIEVNDLNELRKFVGPPLIDSFQEFYNFSKEEAETTVAYYREYFAEKGLLENQPYEGITSLLEKLKAHNKKLILATSKAEVYTRRILDHFDLTKYFDFIAGSTLDETRNKKADVIKYALEKFNVNNLNDTIMIGDRKYDIEGAQACGIDSIGVLYGYGTLAELQKAGATYIANDLNELEKLLLN